MRTKKALQISINVGTYQNKLSYSSYVTVLGNSRTPPPLPNNNKFVGTVLNYNGTFREKDAIEMNVLTGLRATSQFYVFDDETIKIKSVPGTTFLNVFSSKCNTNTEIR